MNLISVIIPAFNAENTIEKCIKSILQNDGVGKNFDIEVIVVDDGSKDKTAALVSSMFKEYQCLRLIQQENSGPSAARWNGIYQSKGQYLAFCDSDDWVESNWLSAMYELITNHDADISVIRAIIGDKINIDFRQELFVWNRAEAIQVYLEHKKINGSFVVKMFKRELFDKLAIDMTMTHCEDDILIWQMLQKVSKVVRAEIPLYHISVHEGSLTNSIFRINRWVSTKKYFDTVISDCTNKAYLRQFLSIAKSYRAWWYYALMKLMIKDSFIDRNVQIELQNAFRDVGLKYAMKLPLKDKVLFMLATINVSMLFKIFSKSK